MLIEKAEALGEPPDDPLLLFSVLYSFWNANVLAFNGDAVRELGAQFLALAEQPGAPAPRMIGHRLVGSALIFTGDIAEGRAHLDRGMALYDPIEHLPLSTRFAQDMGGGTRAFGSLAIPRLRSQTRRMCSSERARSGKSVL